jgi:hypothetical protein
MDDQIKKLSLVVEILTAQRNEALNNFVNALADLNLLREKVKELESQKGQE